MPRDDAQGHLFGHELPPRPVGLPWPPALPDSLRIGTSSWAFAGWSDLVYARTRGKPQSEARLAKEGLREYASSATFRTVGLDKSFYRPLPQREFERLASMVPRDFRFLVKAYAGLVQPPGMTHTRTRPGEFLSAPLMLDAVVGPCALGLGEHLGTLLLQLPPLPLRPRGPVGTAADFADALLGFLAAVRAGAPRVPLSLEVRSVALLTPGFVSGLRELRIDPCLVCHPSMPGIAAQEGAWGEWLRAAPRRIVRWMLHAGQTYAAARDAFEPFDRLLAPDVPTREAIARSVATGVAQGQETFVIVNNKAEGSAPLSCGLLAHAVASMLATR